MHRLLASCEKEHCRIKTVLVHSDVLVQIIDIGVEGLETGSRERIVTIHFRVQTPCCARTAKFLPSLSPVDCVSCSVTGFHSC